MSFELPVLPFAEDALEPYISKETISFHYGKHHATYVNNLNKLIPGSRFENASLETIIKEGEGGVFNNAAQVWNHTFYWNCLSASGGGVPFGKLGEAIDRDFGGFEQFKEQFSQAAATLFGSGWAWLVSDRAGKLSIVQESNAGNPLRQGLMPLLTCDVWEHAYYIDKRNRRPAYIDDFWKIVNWKAAEAYYLNRIA
ncbi:MAG: superoxide dismutase [Bacteroidetes bacterium]|nr:superoxide dismutase [Bacteroidota bacterium]MBU1579343.1 superoxide dismutase [Bacteroidota bacterium]MBU2466207.1 superoxide dismutase [Bacteroidota bacterium]MBU2557090.1 superoxide dismutase [Bacteroidota bacterium]